MPNAIPFPKPWLSKLRSLRSPCAALLMAMLAACASQDPVTASIELSDVNGRRVTVTPNAGATATVLLFVASDCPIANYFAPEIQRIQKTYSSKGVSFYLVYGDGDENAAGVKEHLDAYSYTIPGFLDPKHVLVDLVGASVTPEAAVLSAQGELLYRGRINDLYVDFGKQRAKPTREDLRLALDAILAGDAPQVDRTVAVGCFIPDVEPR